MNWENIMQRATILIVDDEAANVLLLTRLLRNAGYAKVFSTTESTRVQQLCEELQPDLILLDVHMPHMDGLQLLRRLRADRDSRGAVPVLANTGDADSATKLSALMLGARDFLTKPIDCMEAMLRIRNLLEMRFLLQTPARQPMDVLTCATDPATCG